MQGVNKLINMTSSAEKNLKENNPEEKESSSTEAKAELTSIPVLKKKIRVKEKVQKIATKISEADVENNPQEKTWFESLGQPAIDVFQTETELIIQSAIAGIKPKDLEISLQNDMLLIKGQRKKPAEGEKRNYFYQECYWGPFFREIILPLEADISCIEASITEGILTVRMPKIKDEKKKIAVKES